MMKVPLNIGLFLFCLVGKIISQDSTESSIFIDQRSSQGVVLDKGWKLMTADDPEYAKPDFNDSQWQSINPTKDILRQPTYAKKGICWLRLKFSLSADWPKDQIALWIKQYIASEIYLNGKLIYQFGTIGPNPNGTTAYNPEILPIAVTLDSNKNQLLAVRYSVQPDLNFGHDVSMLLPLLEIKIMSSNDAFKQLRMYDRHLPITNTFRIGAYVILALLYLAFFFYNPSYKAYLFFFLFAIFVMPSDILQFNYPPKLKDLLVFSRAFNILWEISHLFLLTAMYFLLNQKRGWIYWCLIGLSIVGMFLNNWFFSELFLVNLINLELVRTCFKTMKLKTRGAWILTTGAVCFLVLMGAFYLAVYFNLDYYQLKLGESFILADVLYGVGQLSIPIATTIYVALDFGFTNHTLQQKLIEVEALSQKTIAQEKLRQQILASQNETLEKEVNQRTAELKQSLDHLKSTQAQLIQSEKMASLGELTSGIAHEIQNPLNFVNNFSDVNKDLLVELKDEIKNGNFNEVTAIADDVIANEEKINHHGKRAESIVKGMLQHSRKSTGTKEPTDINALTDEYMRLSYHGLRAKDKSFNAEFNMNLDPALPLVHLIPQDIGRVFLNLFNNAFWACTERGRLEVPKNSGGIRNSESTHLDLQSPILPTGQAGSNLPCSPFLPLVTLTTKSLKDSIEIRIHDNGPGIPQNIIDKIFQPFFTTKPTGQGTGLGLSLAYDIVKAHGGNIRVVSNIQDHGTMHSDNIEGTTFIVQLPNV